MGHGRLTTRLFSHRGHGMILKVVALVAVVALVLWLDRYQDTNGYDGADWC